MNAWRLEWYRLTRTRRLLALVGVFAFFGFTGPLLATYLEELVAAGGGGVVISTPEPTPGMAIEQFSSNASQIGLLVAIVVAAGALSIDVRPELGAFFRTRVPSTLRLLTPRYVVATLAAMAAFTVGVGAAWYETVVLIGAPDATGMLIGTGLAWLYLTFAIAVVALAASMASNVLTTVAITVVFLLLLPIIGAIEAAGAFLPSTLVGALPDLASGGEPGDYVRPGVTTVLATFVTLALAVDRTTRREL